MKGCISILTKGMQGRKWGSTCRGSEFCWFLWNHIIRHENKICQKTVRLFSWLSLFLHPSLLSSGRPVVGQRDWDVGWPHGQHHSAREEEAVVTGSAFPSTIWQQVRIIYHSFMCRWGFELEEKEGTWGHKRGMWRDTWQIIHVFVVFAS